MQATGLYNDFATLAELRTDARSGAEGNIREVAAQFESLFVQMMLKSMREATMKGGLFDSHQLESYQQMYDQQISLELSAGGGVGLADVLVEQLSGLAGSKEQDGADDGDFTKLKSPEAATMLLEHYRSRVLPSRPAATAGAETSRLPESLEVPPSQAEFVDGLRPLAERAAARLGVSADVLLAQAALETGWGRHVTGDQSGTSNNFFNIKAGNDWVGATVNVPTLEYRDGVAVRESASFRAYASPAESFDDYVEFIERNPRYSTALNKASDSEGYLRELQDAGYATDPAYADKILSIMGRNEL